MLKKSTITLWLALLAIGLAAAPAAVEKHPFSIHDMLAMDRISDPAVSPDGRWVVFTLRTTDVEANRGLTDLWSIDIGGKSLRRLTSHPAADFNPRWSPDGKAVYFLSTRSGSSQVWRIRPDGGEAEQVSRLPLDVSNLAVSPDGRNLVFSLEVFPGLCGSETKKKLDEIAAGKTSGRVYERLFIRHWDSWKDGRRSHLFVLPADGGQARDLMPKMDADAPAKPFGGAEEFTFTPDGKTLVFTARDAGREEAWSTNLDLWVVPLDGSADPRLLTAANKATDTQPLFSPDGRTLASLAMERPGYEADRYRIVLRSWPDGAARVLAEKWDRSPSALCWSADGRTLFATAENVGQHSLFAIDVRTGAVKTLVKEGSCSSPAWTAGGRIVFGLDHLKSPLELWTVRADGSDLRPLTRINGKKLSAALLGDFEQFSFKGWNDETVHGYVVKPVNFDPAQKYPVAFLIHGGPQGSFGNHFHYRWNPQAYAGAGYGAVMIDFHGSTGYGQAFTDSIRGDWGGKPLVDLQKGLAAALERYPWLDGRRVGALGASYGGYMINWIAGAWPDGFRCLVCHDGNLDERLAYFDTEELWFPEWDHMGTPWENPEGYETHNPINLVKNWKTPMLVVHGGLDFRVVETQGMSTFTALQRLGIPSKFLYFPDENHWVLRPQNSIQWHDTVIGWLDQWLKR
jgi:dipeptidyl aminopeptidase/acylaminoacyl peptidase